MDSNATREPRWVEQMNYEFYSPYRTFCDEKMRKTKAVETAAEMCDYSSRRASEIVRIREGSGKT
jgi:hypothetical protein